MKKYQVLVRNRTEETFHTVGKPMSEKKADEAIKALLELRTTAEAKKELQGHKVTPVTDARFKPQKSQRSTERTVLWLVMDTVNQMDVFHWYGRTGEEKCTAVAQALNALNHGKE